MFSPNLLHLWPLLPGLLLPATSGWLMLRLLEWRTPVLSQWERWTLGTVLGLTTTMYFTFLAHVWGGVGLTRWGFLGVQAGVIGVLGVVWWGVCHPEVPRSQSGPRRIDTLSWASLPYWIKIVFIVLGIWTVLKVFATGFTFSLLTPLYVDDAVDNWNLRGKVFFVDRTLTLILPGQEVETLSNSVSSYPPTVPLIKAYLAQILGSWDENLVNSIHVVWFLSVTVLLYLFLRRHVNWLWSCVGVYILTSLPLFLMHGTNPYADVYLSTHIFAAVTLLYLSTVQKERMEQLSFLRLAILPIALLPFMKNEGLLIYFPPLVLTLGILLCVTLRCNVLYPWIRGFLRFAPKAPHHDTQNIATKGGLITILLFIFIPFFILLPWLHFKWSHGLSFGNAKTLPTLTDLQWQPQALLAIFLNSFFLGNWLLLFFVFFALLIWQWRTALRTPLLVLTGFFLVVYFGQMSVFLFTGLSAEAVKQTGYARGIVHLIPIMVAMTTILLRKAFQDVVKKEYDFYT